MLQTSNSATWGFGGFPPQEGVPPLHPLQNFRFAVLEFAWTFVLNVGITLTNFMVAIFATLANFSWQRSIFILGAGLILAATVAVMVIRLHPFTYIGLAIALYIAGRLWLPKLVHQM